MSPPDDATRPPVEPASQRTTDFRPSDAATLPPPAGRAVRAAVPGYELLGELGRGGMGVVYQAVQTRLHRPVALKMILGGDHADPRELARFLAEAEAVAAVKHPHVVQVYEYGEHDGRPYLAMEYLPGGSLAGRLQAAGRLPPEAAADLVRKVALGVQAAHDLGIVHRDLKPANVLFDESGEPKVTDFGLAKRRGGHDLTRTGAVMGTPAYMAPEQAAGKAKFAGPAADVYALGVILYECLTGRPPFRADDAVGLLMKVAEEDPPPVRRSAPGVPKDLERVCLKCLAKDPADRYPAAGLLAEDLGRVLVGESPQAAETGRFNRLLTALGRGRQAADLTRYANFFLALAAVMLVTHSVTGLVGLGELPPWAGTAAFLGRVLGIPALLVLANRGNLRPSSRSELILWSVWGGYLGACGVAGAIQKVQELAGVPVASLYPVYALLTAVAFFSLAPAFWGWCYVIAGVFLVLPVSMAVVPAAAPFLFGACWASVLVAMSRHLRRLAALAPAVPGG